MKKAILGAIVLVAALVVTGCENKKQQKENKQTEPTTTVTENPNRLLIIVDPQIDFTTGSLATAKGPEAMDYLAQCVNNGVLDKYRWVAVTQDFHPANHSSFVEQGGVFPPHCVQETEGMNLHPSLQKAIDEHHGNTEIMYLHKGDLADKEEFSVFQNELSGGKLRESIETNQFEGIDVCGIATDYCVYETVKDLMAFYPANQIRVVTNCIAAVDDNDTKLEELMKENGIEGITF